MIEYVQKHKQGAIFDFRCKVPMSGAVHSLSHDVYTNDKENGLVSRN